MIDTTPCLDIDRAEAGYELATMLGGICSPPSSVFEGDYGHFKTYPNVLNNFADFPNETQSEALFRELPNNGKRSPRSRLACAMARHGFLPIVIGLSEAECCTNHDLAEYLADTWGTGHGFEDLDDLGEDYDDLWGYFDGIGDEESRLRIRQLCDSSLTSGRPAFSPTAAFAKLWKQRTPYRAHFGRNVHI
jgi:hypothetical protein